MPSTRVRQNATIKTLPDYCLIYFDTDDSTAVERTDQVNWMIRGETCSVRIDGQLIIGKILALKGIIDLIFLIFQTIPLSPSHNSENCLL